jgi:DNA polymerase
MANAMLGQCLGCPLGDRKEVPFIGPRSARLALVGEYPGSEEAKKGKPFVGQAGKLLDNLLAFLGLSRNDVRMGNAILCGPVTEDDKKSPWFREVVDRCAMRCAAEGDLGDAKVVVTLGGTGAWSLIGKPVVLGGKWPMRGSVLRSKDGRIVIPTWNPAAILKAGGSDSASKLSDADSEIIALDILRGWRLATGELTEFQPVLRLEADPKVFAQWCRKCDWRVAIDVETDGVDPFTCKLLSVGLAQRFQPINPEPFVPRGGIGDELPTLSPPDRVDAISFWWPNADDEAREELRALLANELIAKVFHNAAFDRAVLERLVGPVCGGIVDTLLLSHARFPDVRVDLADVAQTWLAVRPWKHDFHTHDLRYADDVERAQDKGYAVPTWPEDRVEALLEYNAMDAAATIGIEVPLADECRRENVLDVAAIDTALSREAYRMTVHGVLIDTEVRERLAKETESRLRGAEERLNRLVEEGMRNPADVAAAQKLAQMLRENDGRLNYNSNPMLSLAFDVCGVALPATKDSLTQTGKRAINKKALAPISNHPLVAAMFGCRALARVMSVFFAEGRGVMQLGSDGRLHIPWKVHGTPTGRWASGVDKEDEGGDDAVSINLQNWPDWLRAMVVAPPGYVLIGADYKALEYRNIALYAGEQSLLDLFNDPKQPDLHNINCERLYGDRWRELDPNAADNPFEREQRKKMRKALRSVTKNGLYGAMYLGTPETIQLTIQSRAMRESDDFVADTFRRITRKQCQEFVEAIPRLWPRIEQWRRWAVRDAEENHEVRYPLSGRRRIWPLGMVDPTQAVNSRVQGLGGDIMNWRFLELQRRLPPEARIILQVHDAIVVECPEAMSDAVMKLMVETLTVDVELTDQFDPSVTHHCLYTVDAKRGHAWNEV